jgi:hypothetical protein
MKHAGDRYIMRASDVSGAPADFEVHWVVGGKRMQDDITVLPDGRWQVLPVYFHVTGKSWVDYTEAKQGSLTPEHPFYWTNVRRMANHECLDCHTTALRVTYDEPARKWSTSFIDSTVACESCHGAGGRHAESQEERDVVHPTRSGAVGLSACARCHGPRKPLFPMLDPEHQFELGQPYDEFYDPIVVVQGAGMSPEFFVDGKIAAAFDAVTARFPDVEVQVEVTTPAEAVEAVTAGARFLLCDNMPAALLADTVREARGAALAQVELEATGGLTLAVAREYAETGVDYLSVGALTHSSPVLDIALDLV